MQFLNLQIARCKSRTLCVHYIDISLNGRINTTRTYNLTYKGTYRVKFTTTCDGETYNVYSTEEKY